MRIAKDKFFQAYPPWILPDKREHILGSAFLFSLFYFLVYHWMGLQSMALVFGQSWTAAGLALICGLLWEIKDGFINDGFSWRDLLADTLGVGILWLLAK